MEPELSQRSLATGQEGKKKKQVGTWEILHTYQEFFYFYYFSYRENGQILEQIPQKGSGISIPGDVQD